MKLAGHTIGTPEYTIPAGHRPLRSSGPRRDRAICHEEYRSAIRPDITPAGLGSSASGARNRGSGLLPISPYATDLNSRMRKWRPPTGILSSGR